MLNHLIEHGLPLLGATAVPAYRYLGQARYTSLEYYNTARTRTKTAMFVLDLFATVVSSVILTRGVDRSELFERYDVKLWSFNDNVALFTLATVPSVAVLAALYASFRGVSAIKSAISL